jgi:multiple sugar transport system ATP-binding protein
VNRFVAGFIGMPPMNFFDGTLRTNAGQLPVEEGNTTGEPGIKTGAEYAIGLTSNPKRFTLALSHLAHDVVKRLRDGRVKAVVLGIRPEHLSLHPIRIEDGSIVSQPLTMRLAMIEPLGSDVDLYLQSAGHGNVVARVEAPAGESASGWRVGSEVTVHVDLRRVHLFEPGETGMNLSLESNPSGRSATELAHAMA